MSRRYKKNSYICRINSLDFRRQMKTKNRGTTVIVFSFQNYKCFGIQFYGECWSGEDACDEYDKHGKSKDCSCSGNNNNNKKYDEDSDAPCIGGVGEQYTNFVYEIV